MKNKQRLYQTALNILAIGDEIAHLEKYFNKNSGHRCITVNPGLKLNRKLYLNDSDYKITDSQIMSQIESNLDEIKDLLHSIRASIASNLKLDK